MCSDCPADFVSISVKGEYTGVMLVTSVVLPRRLLRNPRLEVRRPGFVLALSLTSVAVPRQIAYPFLSLIFSICKMEIIKISSNIIECED